MINIDKDQTEAHFHPLMTFTAESITVYFDKSSIWDEIGGNDITTNNYCPIETKISNENLCLIEIYLDPHILLEDSCNVFDENHLTEMEAHNLITKILNWDAFSDSGVQTNIFELKNLFNSNNVKNDKFIHK